MIEPETFPFLHEQIQWAVRHEADELIIPRSSEARCAFGRQGKATDLVPLVSGQSFTEAIIFFQSNDETVCRVRDRDIVVSQTSKSPDRVVLKLVDAQRHMPTENAPEIPHAEKWLAGFEAPGLNIICGMPGSGRRTIADATVRTLILRGQGVRMFDREKPNRADPKIGDVLVSGAVDVDSFSFLVDHAMTNPVLAILGARSAKDGALRLQPVLRRGMPLRMMELSLDETAFGDFRLSANLVRFGER